MPAEFVDFGERWAALHPTWEVRTWGEEDLQWLENRDLFEAANSRAEQSDIARYEVVRRDGGFYVDTDFEPFQALDTLLEDGAELIVAEERRSVYPNSFFAAEPNSPFLSYVVTELRQSMIGNTERQPNEASGPHFFTRCLRRWTATNPTKLALLSRDRLFSVGPSQVPLSLPPLPSTLAVHHWAHSWRPAQPRPKRRTLRSHLRSVLKTVKKATTRFQARWDALEPSPIIARQPIDATYLGDGVVLVNTVYGYPLRAFSSDLNITGSLLSAGTYDPAFHQFLRRELRPWDVIVDVGANIGLFTVAAGHLVGEMGRVIAFEPNPHTFALLGDNVYMNQMIAMRAEIDCLHRAVGAESGSATLSFCRSDMGKASLGSGDVGGDPETCEVEVVALDDVLSDVAEIHLLKVDVEGNELAVLQGMSRLLSERRVRLIDLELADTLAGPSWHALEQFLGRTVEEFGAKTFDLNADGTRRPISLEAALHANRLSHLILEFPKC